MSDDKATIDRQAAQIAMLREALHVARALTMGYINGALAEKSKDEAIADLQIINAALNATAYLPRSEELDAAIDAAAQPKEK